MKIQEYLKKRSDELELESTTSPVLYAYVTGQILEEWLKLYHKPLKIELTQAKPVKIDYPPTYLLEFDGNLVKLLVFSNSIEALMYKNANSENVIEITPNKLTLF